ncbi:MAG: response regulator [Nitriliruptor sp.]|uniref:response regulator n=1 Tax=Nitriliruptor sp. TaxID=2448056 RepID=UPI0034A06FAE
MPAGTDEGAEVTDVVVVSADGGTRAQVALTLSAGRFAVTEADDTDAAIRTVASRRPPLLVLDQALPGKGALALARSIRTEAETAGTRVLLLTSRGDDTADGATGVDATLALPFTAFALLRKVESLLD